MMSWLGKRCTKPVEEYSLTFKHRDKLVNPFNHNQATHIRLSSHFDHRKVELIAIATGCGSITLLIALVKVSDSV